MGCQTNSPPARFLWPHWNRGSPVPGFWIDPRQRDKSLSLQFTVKLDSLAPDQILFDAQDRRR